MEKDSRLRALGERQQVTSPWSWIRKPENRKGGVPGQGFVTFYRPESRKGLSPVVSQTRKQAMGRSRPRSRARNLLSLSRSLSQHPPCTLHPPHLLAFEGGKHRAKSSSSSPSSVEGLVTCLSKTGKDSLYVSRRQKRARNLLSPENRKWGDPDRGRDAAPAGSGVHSHGKHGSDATSWAVSLETTGDDVVEAMEGCDVGGALCAGWERLLEWELTQLENRKGS